jgi:tetratricopeptide (TPR) repeat protein
MTTTPEPAGSLEVALKNAARFLATEPRLAREQAEEILRSVPGHPIATLYLGVAHCRAGDPRAAAAVLQPLAEAHPDWAPAHHELGLTLGAAGQGEAAVGALRRAVEINPELADSWRALADHLHAAADPEAADEAYSRYLKASTRDPRLLEAGAALCDNRIGVAEALLRRHLKQLPTDVAAIRMLAEVAARLGRYGDAEALLTRCLELAPGFTAARHNLAMALHRQSKEPEALAQVDTLLVAQPGNPGYRNLRAAILVRIGEYEDAIRLYEGLLAQYPRQAKLWLSYGHTLKTAGRQADCLVAYRKCSALAPDLGEAQWSLANLKTVRFAPADIEAMQAQVARPELGSEDRLHFHFALGKALEDERDYAASFRHYAEANRLRRAEIHYDPEETTDHLRRSRALFSRDFFAERASYGATDPDPVFIVGLPRSGSTLLEQILASHSAVEGTMELPDISAMARALGGKQKRSDPSRYPENLAELSAAEIRGLGEQYLARTRVQRKTTATFFIDKMPNNFVHLGLIHLALPKARIIDARRHPLGCCFSGYKQHFARGQNFTYSLEEIGRYYRDYVELMHHFDTVLPGRVHRVFYETVVEDMEGEVRRLLDYCGLPFEDACLRFFENDRAVRTASSEQVRQPIYREGLEQWRAYEPWLGPLKSALGTTLTAYPEMPLA